TGVAVEPQNRAVGALDDLPGAHDHGVMDLAFFDGPVGGGVLDVDLDDVADAGVTLIAAGDTDVPGNLGPGVIRHIQTGSNLQHKVKIRLRPRFQPRCARRPRRASSVSTWTAGAIPRCARYRRPWPRPFHRAR